MRALLTKIPEPDGKADSWCGTKLPPVYAPLGSAAEQAWFVDGGNAGVIDAPHFTLQKLRAVAVHYPTKKVLQREELVLLTKQKTGWRASREDGSEESFEADEIADAVTKARQHLEHAIAREAFAHTSGVVVLDGDVAPDGCVALQKSITVLTTNNFPLASVLTAAGPWAAQLGDVIAVKLHARARHVLLAHGLTGVNDPILKTLAYYSNDALFPGYPGGLVLADRLARVSREEAEALKIKARALQRELRTRIERAESSVDSHTILDRMG